MKFVVVFGSGDEISTEIEYIAMPHDLYKRDYCGGLTYKLFYNECINDDLDKQQLRENLRETLHVMYVKLYPGGQVYSLSEAYHAQFNTETLTLTVYV